MLREIRRRGHDFLSEHFGNTRIYRFFLSLSEYAWFTSEVFLSARYVRGRQLDTFLYVIYNQIRFTGTNALPLLSIIALSIGATTIIQAFTFLPKLGQENFIGNLLNLVIVREIGPLITAIIVLARSGSAIASELATQKLHKEIEAIELMGINPHFFFVLPRVIGGAIAIMLLIVYFDFIAFIGGFLFAKLAGKNFPLSSFLETILRSTGISEILSTIIKSLTYGIVIPLTTSFFGMKPQTLFQIPIYVSKAVMNSLLAVFLLNAAISVFFYI